MANIKKYTQWLQFISIAFAVIMCIEICIRWFLGSVIPSSYLSNVYVSGFYGLNKSWFKELSHMSFIQKLLGFISESIGLVIVYAGVMSFNKLLKQLRRGAFFTSDIIRLLSTLSKFALGWALYTPLRTTLLSVITTFHKGPGNRILSIEFGLKDMINIFIFVCIILITALIQEGLNLKKEQDLTI